MDPKRRAKIGAAFRARWADLAVRANYMTHHTDPTVRETRSAALTARRDDPAERKELVSGMVAARRRKERKLGDKPVIESRKN